LFWSPGPSGPSPSGDIFSPFWFLDSWFFFSAFWKHQPPLLISPHSTKLTYFSPPFPANPLNLVFYFPPYRGHIYTAGLCNFFFARRALPLSVLLVGAFPSSLCHPNGPHQPFRLSITANVTKTTEDWLEPSWSLGAYPTQDATSPVAPPLSTWPLFPSHRG